MDKLPFLILDIAPSIHDSEILELQKFHKEKFDPEIITAWAEKLKYTNEIKRFLKQQIKEPGEDFIKFFIKQTTFHGNVSKLTVKKFSPIVTNAFQGVLEKQTGADKSESELSKNELSWNEKAAWTLNTAKELLGLIDVDDDKKSINFTQSYISININGKIAYCLNKKAQPTSVLWFNVKDDKKSINFTQSYISININGKIAYCLNKKAQPTSVLWFNEKDDEKADAIKMILDSKNILYNYSKSRDFVINVDQNMIKNNEMMFQEIMKIRHKEIYSSE